MSLKDKVAIVTGGNNEVGQPSSLAEGRGARRRYVGSPGALSGTFTPSAIRRSGVQADVSKISDLQMPRF